MTEDNSAWAERSLLTASIHGLDAGGVALVAERAGVAVLEIEIVCNDAAEHRRRVESRQPDIVDHGLPTWQEVVERDYHAWDRDRLVVDTAASKVK